MKKILLIIALASITCISFSAKFDPSINTNKGEQIFIEHADKCLAVMDQAAQNMAVKGVAVIAYIPGDVSDSWISKMKVVSALHNGSANYLAVAYSKAAEMADTFKDSGGGVREPMVGEFGWQGGIIRKVSSGYILAVFSGASGEQDVEIAEKGIESLSAYY